MSKTVKSIIIVVLVAVLGIGAYFLITYLDKASKKISTYEFESLIQPYEDDENNGNGDGNLVVSVPQATGDKKPIVKVVFNGYNVYGYTDVKSKTYAYWAHYPSVYTYESMTDWVNTHGKGLQDYDMSDPNAGAGWGNVLYIGVLVIGVVAFFLILRATSGGGGKVMNFGKTKAKITTNIKVRFSDVAGAEEEKEELDRKSVV